MPDGEQQQQQQRGGAPGRSHRKLPTHTAAAFSAPPTDAEMPAGGSINYVLLIDYLGFLYNLQVF